MIKDFFFMIRLMTMFLITLLNRLDLVELGAIIGRKEEKILKIFKI